MLCVYVFVVCVWRVHCDLLITAVAGHHRASALKMDRVSIVSMRVSCPLLASFLSLSNSMSFSIHSSPALHSKAPLMCLVIGLELAEDPEPSFMFSSAHR